MFRRYRLIALVGLLFAAAGLWFDAARTEFAIQEALVDLHRPDQPLAPRNCDCLYYMDYAQQMLNTGALRIRTTHMDNAPMGRENIGWAALTMWHLAIVAKIWAVATGLPVHEAVTVSSQWANPILYFAALGAILYIGRRTRTFPAAAMAVLVLATSPRAYFDFGYAAPDHHGWHELTTFSTLVCLAAGIRRADRKYWFALAGFFAAVAVWIGATEQIVPISMACIGALAGMLYARLASRFAGPGNAKDCDAGTAVRLPDPACWRLFGVVAAVGALLFYIFEFAPNLFRMRLEANHPFYSLMFLAGGEFLCRAQRVIFAGTAEKRSRSDLPVLVSCTLLLLAMAIACVSGPASWHALHLPYIQRYHRVVAECMPLFKVKGFWGILFITVPVFLAFCGGIQALRRSLLPADRIALFICTLPCAVCIAASLLQYRWSGLAGACAAALAAFLFSPRTDAPAVNAAQPEERPMVLRSPRWAAVCILVPVLVFLVWCSQRIGDNTDVVSAETIAQLGSAEVAEIVRRDAKKMGREPVVLFLSQYTRQSWIGYVYGIPCVGSLYWDNPDGLLDQLTFLSCYDEETARRIAIKHGLTHVIVNPSQSDARAFHYMLHGTWESPHFMETLACRLATPTPTPPPWLQLLPTYTPVLKQEGARIYRVVP